MLTLLTLWRCPGLSEVLQVSHKCTELDLAVLQLSIACRSGNILKLMKLVPTFLPKVEEERACSELPTCPVEGGFW